MNFNVAMSRRLDSSFFGLESERPFAALRNGEISELRRFLGAFSSL